MPGTDSKSTTSTATAVSTNSTATAASVSNAAHINNRFQRDQLKIQQLAEQCVEASNDAEREHSYNELLTHIDTLGPYLDAIHIAANELINAKRFDALAQLHNCINTRRCISLAPAFSELASRYDLNILSQLTNELSKQSKILADNLKIKPVVQQCQNIINIINLLLDYIERLNAPRMYDISNYRYELMQSILSSVHPGLSFISDKIATIATKLYKPEYLKKIQEILSWTTDINIKHALVQRCWDKCDNKIDAILKLSEIGEWEIVLSVASSFNIKVNDFNKMFSSSDSEINIKAIELLLKIYRPTPNDKTAFNAKIHDKKTSLESRRAMLLYGSHLLSKNEITALSKEIFGQNMQESEPNYYASSVNSKDAKSGRQLYARIQGAIKINYALVTKIHANYYGGDSFTSEQLESVRVLLMCMCLHWIAAETDPIVLRENFLSAHDKFNLLQARQPGVFGFMNPFGGKKHAGKEISASWYECVTAAQKRIIVLTGTDSKDVKVAASVVTIQPSAPALVTDAKVGFAHEPVAAPSAPSQSKVLGGKSTAVDTATAEAQHVAAKLHGANPNAAQVAPTVPPADAKKAVVIANETDITKLLNQMKSENIEVNDNDTRFKYCLCKINFTIMHDPVFLSSGQTVDRSAIIKRNPFTNEEITGELQSNKDKQDEIVEILSNYRTEVLEQRKNTAAVDVKSTPPTAANPPIPASVTVTTAIPSQGAEITAPVAGVAAAVTSKPKTAANKALVFV